MAQIPDTRAGRALAYMQKKYPELYQALVVERPDLIQEVYGAQMSGLGEVGGLLDDLLNFGTKSLDLYKQQQTFKAAMKQATQVPVQTIQAQPIQPAVVSTNLAPYTQARIQTTKTVFGSMLPVLAIGGIGAAIFLMRGKKRR